MTDTERNRIEEICKVANVKDIGELSDGFHTFNGLYEQRMILFRFVGSISGRTRLQTMRSVGNWMVRSGSTGELEQDDRE